MTARIVIGTPMLDWYVGGNHHANMWELLRHDGQDWTILDPKIITGCDLVRARSRIVRMFLEETDGTHLLFLDADVACPAKVLSALVAAEVDAVGCAYPKKCFDEYGRCAKLALVEDPLERVEGPLRSVKSIGMGCVLLTRELLDEMTRNYIELTALDDGLPCVMLFSLLMKGGALLPEDYSFCERARTHTRIWQYTEATLEHEGHHIFVADRDHG